MDGKEAINYIHSRMKFGSVPGLERISQLCEMLGNPQKNMRYVHVAGTNGKGSTSTMIARSLMNAGYKTGLFTSPYVTDFRERICIDGEMISEQDLGDYTQRVKECVDVLEKKNSFATEFEIITAVAFLYYCEKKCDVVVLEVGMGGLYDSTNIIENTDVCVITSISYDHTQVLGDTIEEIAFNKAGIIKENSSVALYPQIYPEAESVIKNAAESKSCRLYPVIKSDIKFISNNANGCEFDYKGKRIKTSLIGEHQAYNGATAYEACLALNNKGFSLTENNIIDGIFSASLPARVQIVSREPLIVIDGGHNEDGVTALKNAVESSFKGYKITGVMGMMKDKDVDAAVKMIAPLCKKIYTVTVNNPRSISASELKEKALNYCEDVIAVDDAKKGFLCAKEGLKEGEMLLVSGSLYLACEINDKE